MSAEEPAGTPPANAEAGRPAGARPSEADAGPGDGGRPGLPTRVRQGAVGRWRQERARRPWLDHLVRAYQRYKGTNGDHLAAAITYFSFLALFPLMLLGISIAAFVLSRQPDLLADLVDSIRRNVPGSLGDTLNDVLVLSLQRKTTVGLVGLLGVAYAGLNWVGNLRTALQVVWACEKADENPIKAKLGDLLVLAGLGIGALVSVALTVGGTAAADQLIDLAGLTGTTGLGTASAVLAILLAVAADTLIFAWLFVRLPRRPVRYGSVLRGALFGAVGYEVLKLVGAFYLARVSGNGGYGAFAGAVGLLIWIDLVARFLLFAGAWTATAPQPPAGDACADTGEPGPGAAGEPGKPAPAAPAANAGDAARAAGAVPAAAAAPGRSGGSGPPGGPGGAGRAGAAPNGRRVGAPRPGAVAGVLVGAGAALGAAAASAGHRLRHRADRPRAGTDADRTDR